MVNKIIAMDMIKSKSMSIALLTILFCFFISSDSFSQSYNTLKIESVEELKEFFKYTPDRIPLLCGHRGGAAKGYPENSIATFENAMATIPIFFELDPRLTKDSVVVVMHDATLDRTTTGSGKLSEYTWEELQELKLKDPEGNITPYGISTLDEVLQWAKGKTILMLDKKDVPLSFILDKINKHKAESYVLVSSYDPEEAVFYHKHNKNIMFEAFIRSIEELEEYEKTGIPWENMIAFAARRKPVDKDLYDALHTRGVMCLFYTTPELEKKIKDPAERRAAYQNTIHEGADILLSDRIFEVYDAIKQLLPENSSKKKFFVKTEY